MKRTLPATLLAFLTAFPVTADAGKTDDPKSRSVRKPTRRTSVSAAGVRLSYLPQRMPQGRRTTARAESLIRGLDATMSTTIPLGYGRRVLAAGNYVARVEGKSGEEHFLVISSVTSGRSKTAGKTAAKTAGRKKKAPSTKKAARTKQAAQTKKPLKKHGKRPAKTAAKTEAPPVELRARLRLAPSQREKPLDALSIELEIFATGTKLRVTLGAGSVAAVANLRFVDPSGKVKVERPVPEKASGRRQGAIRKRSAGGPKAAP